jgi:hypothetical protein
VKRNVKNASGEGIAPSLFLIPLLFIGAAISAPFAFIMNSVWRRREQRFVRMMRAKRRLMHWPEFVNQISQNCGTTIIERISIKGRTLWWWTPDDIYAISPHPIESSPSSFPDPSFAPFHLWCHEIYTNAATGRAILISCTPEQRRSFKGSIAVRHLVTTWTSREARTNHVKSIV